MKLKSLIVVFAAALGLSGQASAAYIDGNDANGSSLILNVFDTVSKASFSELLAPQFGTFNPSVNNQVFTGGASTFASLFGASSASNIRWEVVANSTPGANQGFFPGDLGPWSIAFTATSQPASMNNGSLAASAPKLNTWISTWLNGHNTGGITSSTSSSDTWNMNASLAPWGGVNGGGTLPFSITGTGFGSLSYFTVSGSSSLSADPSTFAQIAGTWSLASNGTLTWNAAQVGAVPIPAAVWLLGSGLFGLIGVARRRNNGGSEVVAA